MCGRWAWALELRVEVLQDPAGGPWRSGADRDLKDEGSEVRRQGREGVPGAAELCRKAWGVQSLR